MNERVIDVSALERETVDSRHTLWWGNLAMMTIEGTMFAMVIGAYLYLRTVNLDWPPSTVIKPDLVLPTVNMLIMLVTGVVMFIVDRASKRAGVTAARLGLAFGVIAGIAILAIRSMIVANLGFKWSDHAYGSVIWTMYGFHTLHVLAAIGETVLLLVWSLTKPVIKKTLLDFRCLAVYWYFVALSWIPFYVIIYIAPYIGRKERF